MSDITPVVAAHSIERMQTRSPELLQQVRSISVIDNASYVEVCNQKLAAADMLAIVEAITKNIKVKHKDALDSALMPWDRIAAPLKEAKALAEQKRKAYKTTTEAAVATQVQADQHAAHARAVDEVLSNAVALVEAGHDDVAEVVLNTPVDVPPVQYGPAVPKVKGIVDRKTWKVAVTEKKAVVLKVARILLGQEPGADDILDALDINLSYFKSQVTQDRTAFQFDGIKTWQE